MRILILKTGALGDVLRTTSIVPGLHQRFPGCEITWVTAPAAIDLVQHHPGVARVVSADPREPGQWTALAEAWSTERFDWIISLDDEAPICGLASSLASERLSGAFVRAGGELAYSEDVGEWFDMGLLSKHGKVEADRLKLANSRSHAQIFATMFGIAVGEPQLPLTEEARAFGRDFGARCQLQEAPLVVALNTGAGGRWRTKELPVDRTLRVMEGLAEHEPGARLLVLGGPAEQERNAELVRGIEASCPGVVVDTGTGNSIQEFAAIVSLADLLVSSDSLALHVGVARGVPVTSFFAPTSAAEIELFGRGAKLTSTSPDYCSYAPDADNSSITAARVLEAALAVLAAHPPRKSDRLG